MLVLSRVAGGWSLSVIMGERQGIMQDGGADPYQGTNIHIQKRVALHMTTVQVSTRSPGNADTRENHEALYLVSIFPLLSVFNVQHITDHLEEFL